MRRSLPIRSWLVPGLVFLLAAGVSPQAGKNKDEKPGCWPSAPGTDPALCSPNDPDYADSWEFRSDIPEEIDRSKMHPSGLALGAIGFSLDFAWQHTIGRSEVVIAVLDSGIRWDDRELVRKLYLNRGELPLPEGADDYDRNADGVFNIDDYHGDSRVSDTNGNGFLDAQDLIAAFSDCNDDDGNGYPDDISGYDLFSGEHCGRSGGDNDPHDETDFGHGSGIASSAAAEKGEDCCLDAMLRVVEHLGDPRLDHWIVPAGERLNRIGAHPAVRVVQKLYEQRQAHILAISGDGLHEAGADP